MRPELSRTVPLLSQCLWSGQRHPHRIEAELISALGMGTNLDVAAADQSRPSATRAAKLIHPMRRIFIPPLARWGSHIFRRPNVKWLTLRGALTAVIKL